MPDVTAQATTFRTKRYTYRAYLSYLPQTPVFAGSVDGTPSSWPAQSFEVTSVTTGAIGDCVEGQTIEFFDGSGDSRGILRVADGAGSGTTLQIAEVSQGTVNLQDGDTFIVYDEFRIWDKLVSATSKLNKDSRITYSDQNANPPPVANAGGLWAGFLDDGQSYATVTFEANVSYVIDPDSGGTLTYLWDVDDGTITVGSTTTSAITVQFPAGFRHVQLTVTDSGNSKSTVRWVPVWVHDPDADDSDYPKRVIVEDRSYTEQGWSVRFELPYGDEASLDNLPDGALVVLWEDQRYSGTQANYGSNVTNRSHIKFVGYLDRSEITIDADTDTVLFTAIGPLAALAKTPALPQLTVQKSSPTKWHHLKSNTVYRTLWYLWHWHTTAFAYFDFVRPASVDLSFTRLATTVISNQMEQFKDIASALGMVPTCDWLGRLIMDSNPQYENANGRSGRTTAYDFTTADIVAIEWEQPYYWDVKTVVGEGITDGSTTSANKPVYSHAPGSAPASRGTGTETYDRLIVANQDALNQRTVLRFAEINGLYYGRMVPRNLRLTLRGGYDVIDPALQEFVTITLPATTNRRGIAFTSDTRWLVRTADITYDAIDGTKEVIYTLDHETFLDYGDFDSDDITDVRPTPEESGLPDFEIPDLIFPGWPEPEIPSIGTGTLLIVHEGGVALTTNFNNPEASGGPTWTTTTLATLGITGTPEGATVDPFSPQYLGTGTDIYILIATTAELGVLTWDRSDDSLSYSSNHTFTYSNTQGAARAIETTRGVNGLAICVTNYMGRSGHTGVYAIASTDGGATWGSEVTLDTFYNTANTLRPGLYIGRGGAIYTTAMTGTGGNPNFTGRKSTDSGASYSSTLTNPLLAGKGLAGCVHLPWQNNAAESLLYYGSLDSTPINILYRVNGTTQTDITPTDSGAQTYTARWQRAIATADNNRSRLSLAGHGSESGVGVHRTAFLSADGGDTWVQLTDPILDSDVTTIDHPCLHTFVGENGTVYYWGRDGYISVGQWNDLMAGGSLDIRRGDLGTDYDVINIFGG